MKFIHRLAIKWGLIKAEMPAELPHIALYNLIILDRLTQQATNLAGIKQAIDDYPENTHREGFVCKSMGAFVAEFATFDLLKQGIEQQMDKNGGRSSTESHYDSMERLESGYEE